MKKNKHKNPRLDRYFRNLKSAKKICKILGLQVIGFNPDWLVRHLGYPSYHNGSMNINDGLMGRLATLFSLSWEFDITDKNVKSSIENQKSHMGYMKEWGYISKAKYTKRDKDLLIDRYKSMEEKTKENIKGLQLELEMRKKRIKDPTIIEK